VKIKDIKNKILKEYDIVEKEKELKKIKSNSKYINSILKKPFNNPHMACIIVKLDENNDYILLEYNNKSKTLDELNDHHINKKLIDIYKSIDHSIFDSFNSVINDGAPQRHQKFYHNNKGYRDSYIYRIETENGYEIVSIYEDITYVKDLMFYNRLLKKILKYKIYAMILIVILISIYFSTFYTNMNNINNIDRFIDNKDIMVYNKTRSPIIYYNKIDSGLMFYQKEKYSNVIPIYEKMKNNNFINFHLGVSYMKTNSFHKSIICFEGILKDKQNLYIDRCQWLLSLCYIKTENPKGISLLKDIKTLTYY